MCRLAVLGRLGYAACLSGVCPDWNVSRSDRPGGETCAGELSDSHECQLFGLWTYSA